MLDLIGAIHPTLTIEEHRAVRIASSGRAISEAVSEPVGDGTYRFMGKTGVWRTLDNGDRAFFTTDGERLVGGGPPAKPGPSGGRSAGLDKAGILAAYSDQPGKRSLFAVGKPMSVKDWADTMKKATPGGYNEFEAGAVAKVLSKFEGRIKVIPAREMSVAAYIEADPDTLGEVSLAVRKMRRARPDEIEIDTDSTRVKRTAEGDLIRKPDYKYKKGDPFDAPYETEPNPMKGKLRLWWD